MGRSPRPTGWGLSILFCPLMAGGVVFFTNRSPRPAQGNRTGPQRQARGSRPPSTRPKTGKWTFGQPEGHRMRGPDCLAFSGPTTSAPRLPPAMEAANASGFSGLRSRTARTAGLCKWSRQSGADDGKPGRCEVDHFAAPCHDPAVHLSSRCHFCGCGS